MVNKVLTKNKTYVIVFKISVFLFIDGNIVVDFFHLFTLLLHTLCCSNFFHHSIGPGDVVWKVMAYLFKYSLWDDKMLHLLNISWQDAM